MRREVDNLPRYRNVTRFHPKRAAEVLDGGSIYWIIKGYIRARQRIVDFQDAVRDDAKPRCAIILDPEVVPTVLKPHRPMQGWRYLDPLAAPEDASSWDSQVDALPGHMAEELRELGLL